jgi:hypothetical protein
VTDERLTARDDLEREARALHRALFRTDPPPIVVRRYVAAYEAGLGHGSQAEATWLRRVLAGGADLEAMELALRRRNRNHVLVRKFRIMTYIAEGSAGYEAMFVNDRRRAARALVELALAGSRSIWKWCKGQYLLQRLS